MKDSLSSKLPYNLKDAKQIIWRRTWNKPAARFLGTFLGLKQRFFNTVLRRKNELDDLGQSQFLNDSFTNFSGSLRYHLFIPSNHHAGMSLLVMLHGCNQDAEIFSVGTRMNEHAEQLGFMVLYPAQSGAANANKCWNWFKSANQYRNMGEPAVIAGMTKKIMREYAINSRKVYIAGLSSGAAMAYIVGSVYADIFAAIGVHSGLLYRGVNNIFSALAAMKAGSEQAGQTSEITEQELAPRITQPLIIFHGDNDQVVHAQNAIDLMAYHHQQEFFKQHSHHESEKNYSHTRTIYKDANGADLAEKWIIHGAGHAWSGGCVDGNFTDPKGPDASFEMLRFFMKLT